jgi:MFS transporter, ACS family, D-galactonate transporter
MLTTSKLSNNRRIWATGILQLGGALATFASVLAAGTLPLVGAQFHANNAALGVLLSAYLAGFGLFQIVAGFGALRAGPRKIYLTGLLLIGLPSLVTGSSGSLAIFALLRFVAGTGQALTSGTAYGLLSTYYPEGQRGKSFGLFLGVTNGLGGLLGLPLSTSLGLAYGWAVPYESVGVIILAVSGLSFVILPRAGTGPSTIISVLWKRSLQIFRSKSIWGLALGLAGFAAASSVPIDYLAQYFAQIHPAWGIKTASEIAATGIGFSLPGGIIGGWIGDRGWNRKAVLLTFGTMFGLLWITLPFLPLFVYWGLYAIAGIAVGLVNALMFLTPSLLNESQGEGVTLAIGLINTVQLIFDGIFLAFFGYVSLIDGYTPAWILTGVACLILLPFLFLVASNQSALKNK